MGTRKSEYDGDGRPTCYTCFRPTSYCMCGLVAPFEAHFNILILQHPNERGKYYGTAKIVTSAITNSRLMRGLIFEEERLEDAFANQDCYVLFPGNDALDCQEVSLNSKSTLIVIDGTWSEAGKIYRRNPLIPKLPKVSFRTALQSNYKIRKQPKLDYLSTLESVGHVLRQNALVSGEHERIPHYDNLFSGFEKMVDRQLSHFPRMGASYNPRTRYRSAENIACLA